MHYHQAEIGVSRDALTTERDRLAQEIITKVQTVHALESANAQLLEQLETSKVC